MAHPLDCTQGYCTGTILPWYRRWLHILDGISHWTSRHWQTFWFKLRHVTMLAGWNGYDLRPRHRSRWSHGWCSNIAIDPSVFHGSTWIGVIPVATGSLMHLSWRALMDLDVIPYRCSKVLELVKHCVGGIVLIRLQQSTWSVRHLFPSGRSLGGTRNIHTVHSFQPTCK